MWKSNMPQQNKWLILMCLVVMGYTGCATRAWVHPSKGETEFHADASACRATARQAIVGVNSAYGSNV